MSGDIALVTRDEPESLSLSFIRGMLKHRLLIVVGWLLLFLGCLPLAWFTVHATELRIRPARGSMSEHGLALMRDQFPDKAAEGNEIVMITCRRCSAVLNETFTTKTLEKLAAKMIEMHAKDDVTVSGWDQPTAAELAGARLKQAADTLRIPPPPNPYLSEDGRTVMYRTLWTYTDNIVRLLREFVAFVDEQDQQGVDLGFDVYIFGPLSMLVGLNSELIHEMMVKEIFVVPIAILVLLYQVRSARLTLLSGVTLAVSIVVSLGLLYFVKMFIRLLPTCPLFVMTLCIALAVDYSLFIFARFREELQCGSKMEEAVEISLDNSGRVIALSGSILVCSAILNNIFAGEVIRAMAITTAMSVLVVIVVHMTLTPCMMTLFPAFFSYGLKGEEGSGDPRGSMKWFKWGQFITSGWRPPIVMAVIYGLMIPVILRVFTYNPTTDIGLEIPNGSNSHHAYKLAQASIPNGEMWPIFMVNAHGDIRSDAAFDKGCLGIRKLVEFTKGTDYEVRPGDFFSPFTPSGDTAELLKHLPGNCPALTCFQWSRPPPECPFLPSARQLLEGSALNGALLPGIDDGYRQVWKLHVNDDNSSALTRITARFDQTGHLMGGLYRALKRIPTDGVYGPTVTVHEISLRCYQRWGIVLLLNLIVMSMFIGYSFKTLLVPLKLFLTVVIPLAFVYGVLIAVYQDGLLNWMNTHGLKSVGVFWVTPIVTLPLHLGLAVDYDVFIFARVVELREQGYGNRAAVVGGLATTGPPITSAGLIMAFAFFGMLLSKTVMNCQVGLIISLGVLLDSFVIRAVLVPCVLCMGDRMNYWPLEMPKETQTMEDLQKYLMETGAPKSKDVEK